MLSAMDTIQLTPAMLDENSDPTEIDMSGWRKKEAAWPVPHVVRCLDDGIGTIARPLTRDLYMQTQDMRFLPLRKKMKTEAMTEQAGKCSCSCFSAFIITWLILVAFVAVFFFGMVMESTYLRRFKRTEKEDPIEWRVKCPGKSFQMKATNVTKFLARQSVEGLSAEGARDCKAMCEKDDHCIRAYFYPTRRNCFLWTDDKCSLPNIPSRDNTGDILGMDCVGEPCELFERLCSACQGERRLSDFWHLNGCLRLRDYEELAEELCSILPQEPNSVSFQQNGLE